MSNPAVPRFRTADATCRRPQGRDTDAMPKV